MEKQDHRLIFRKIVLTLVGFIIILTSLFSQTPAYSGDLKLLKPNNISAEQWIKVKSLFLPTENMAIIEEGKELFAEQNRAVKKDKTQKQEFFVVPLTSTLSEETVSSLHSFLKHKGSLILITLETYPNESVLRLLKQMGINLSPLPTLSSAPTPASQQQQVSPLFSLMTPVSRKATLFLKPVVEPSVTGSVLQGVWTKAFSKAVPIAVNTEQGSLVFAGWDDFPAEQRRLVLKQVVEELKGRTTALASSSPSNPLSPSGSAVSAKQQITLPRIPIKAGTLTITPNMLSSSAYNLMEKPPVSVASKDLKTQEKAIQKTPQKPMSRPDNPIAFRDDSKENRLEKVSKVSLASPTPSPHKHLNEFLATPASSTQIKTQGLNSLKELQPPVLPQITSSQNKASSKAETISSKDSMDMEEKHPDPIEKTPESEDPLFNDALMSEEDNNQTQDNNLITAIPHTPAISSNFDFGSYSERLKHLDEYRNWVEDAIESALQLSLPIPIKKAQQLLLKADLQRAYSESAYRKGRTGEGEYAYDEAYQLMNQALVLTTLSSKVEGRAIWLDRGSIVDSKNPRGLRKLIAKLDDAGINVVYFETLNAGFLMYPSELTPQNPLTKGWDPLKVAVDEAHKRGMELHAWVWTFAVGNTKHNPLISKTADYPGPMLEEAGLMDEALQTENGSIMPPRQTEYWLSPASLKGRQFIKNIYKEIITHYDVDGLHLDYIRYPFQRPQSQVGYETISRQRYHEDTGLKVGSRGDFNLKSFVAWKTLQVNTFVKELSDELRAIKPDLKLSAAVFPMKRTQRILAIQQDWETWIEKGWIDTLSPMIYTSSPSLFRSTVSRIIKTADQQAVVYPGVAIFRLDTDEMLNHLKVVRESGGLGNTLFAFAHLDDSKQKALHHGPYKIRNAIPPHHDPFYALNTLIKYYKRNFERLATKGELMVLTPEGIETLKGNLNQLEALSNQLKQETENAHQFNVKTLAQLKEATTTLDENTRTWLQSELNDRPFRAQFFAEYIIRIKLLLDYAEKQLLLNNAHLN